MFDSAVQFLEAGLENNEVVMLLSNSITRRRLNVLRYVYQKKYEVSLQKTGLVFLCDVTGLYFLRTNKNVSETNQKVLYSWTKIIREAKHLGKGLRAFVDLENLFHDNIVERPVSWKSEINLALLDYDRFPYPLRIMNGCLESDIAGLAPESFRLIHEYYDGVYVVPQRKELKLKKEDYVRKSFFVRDQAHCDLIK